MFATFGHHLGGLGISSQMSPSIWMDNGEDLFSMMMSPGLVSNSLWQSPSPCCRGAATQGRDMAYKLKEIKHRDAMKRQAEIERQEKRLKDQRRKKKVLQMEKGSKRAPLCWTILDDCPTHLTVGVRMKASNMTADNVEIRGDDDGMLTVSATRNVPMYRRVRDIFGNTALQRCGTKKEKAWGETVKVDPSLDVENVSARLYKNMILIQIPYKSDSKEVMIESSTEPVDKVMMEPSTSSDPASHIEDGAEEQEKKDDIDIQIDAEPSPNKIDHDRWEELDGSIEDCEYE